MLPRTSRVVRKVVCSLSGNRRYSNRRIQLSSEVEWWKDDARLVQKTSDPSRPHIIFLEGPAGVAKRDVMWKLNNVGYPVINHPFYDALKASNNHNLEEITEKWVDKIVSDVKEQGPGKQHQGNVLIVHRSPLSGYVYATEDAKGKKYLEMMNELKGKYSASVLLCHSDGIRTLERLGQRAFYAEGVDKDLRCNLLREEDRDYQQQITERYDALLESGIIDARLATTSSKQGVAQLLKIAGVKFNAVWDELAKRIPNSSQR